MKENLWALLGFGGMLIPIAQIFAGFAKIIGIALAKSNIEAAGLIMVASLFSIRAVMLIIDGDIGAADINNEVIATGIIVSNVIRLMQIVNGRKFLLAGLCVAEDSK